MPLNKDAFAALDDILADPPAAPPASRGSSPSTAARRTPAAFGWRTAAQELDDILGEGSSSAPPVGNDAPVPGPDPVAPSDPTLSSDRQADLFDDLTGKGKKGKKATIHLVDSEESYGTEAKPLSETVASDGGYAEEPADVSDSVADTGPQSKHPRSLTTHPVNGFQPGKASFASDGSLVRADYDPAELNDLFGLDGGSDDV